MKVHLFSLAISLFCHILLFDILLVYSFTRSINNIPFSIRAVRNNYDSSYLERLVDRKRIEVDTLLRQHQDVDDPLVMRLSYMSSECKYNITRALRLGEDDQDGRHLLSVLVDMKRKSPTIPERREVVDFSTAGKFSELLTLCGTDAFLVNTDEMVYNGQLSDLPETVKAVKQARPSKPPACIAKDIIIHPVQIAQALELGASGVLLMTSVVGGDLEVLLDACTVMGTEALVEVHTPNELDFALSRGATIFLVNMWDRITGKHYPDQVKGLISMMPMNAVAVAAGNIRSLEQAKEMGYYGYDAVVLGRGITELDDIKGFVDGVHEFRGMPRGMGLGMKGLPWK